MAAYNTTTKVIIADLTDESDQTADSLAKRVNDYIQTLDDTTNTIIDIQSTMVNNGVIAYIIVHKG